MHLLVDLILLNHSIAREFCDHALLRLKRGAGGQDLVTMSLNMETVSDILKDIATID